MCVRDCKVLVIKHAGPNPSLSCPLCLLRHSASLLGLCYSISSFKNYTDYFQLYLWDHAFTFNEKNIYLFFIRQLTTNWQEESRKVSILSQKVGCITIFWQRMREPIDNAKTSKFVSGFVSILQLVYETNQLVKFSVHGHCNDWSVVFCDVLPARAAQYLEHS